MLARGYCYDVMLPSQNPGSMNPQGTGCFFVCFSGNPFDGRCPDTGHELKNQGKNPL